MDPEREPQIVLAGLDSSQQVVLTPLQEALAPYAPDIAAFWWTLWVIVLAAVIARFVFHINLLVVLERLLFRRRK